MRNHKSSIAAIEALKARIDSTSPNAAKLVNVIDQLKSGVAALIDLHATPNPSLTEAANFKKVQDGATKLETKRKAAFANVNTIVREGSDEVKKRMDAKVKLVPDQYAGEVRQLFRSLSPGEQTQFLAKLARDNKGPSLAAIISVPSELTGITEEFQKRYQSMVEEIHAPDECKEFAALMASLEPALVAMDVVKTVVEDFSDPYKLASIRHGEALAEAAENTLNATLAA